MKLRALPALLLALCLLGGCQQTPPTSEGSQGSQEEPFVFTRENFPRMNGSTSTVPLGKTIASVLLGEGQDEVSDLIQFTKTTQSYFDLMDGSADILISAEPADSVWDEKNARNYTWEMQPFATDALVFVVNQNNPIDSLTTEQVQRIYTGEFTNWSEVGGEDLDIVPFQRNEGAGSQTAMLNLVMQDRLMMEAPEEYVRGEMGDLLRSVAAYDNSASAIGYTVYYYANDMKMAEGLKILAIDGVMPTDETIRDKSYPFLNNYYTVIPSGLSEEDPARILYNWILSEDGQRVVARQGYVSVLDVEVPS